MEYYTVQMRILPMREIGIRINSMVSEQSTMSNRN